MSLLRDWPGGAYCEQLGSGVRLMVGAMRDAGKPDPVLREEGNEFVVYCFASAEARAALPALPAPVSAAGRPMPASALPGVTDPRLAGLNERQLRALSFLQEHGRISNEEYRVLINCSVRMASRDLGDFRDRELIVGRSAGRALHYVPAGSAYDDDAADLEEEG